MGRGETLCLFGNFAVLIKGPNTMAMSKKAELAVAANPFYQAFCALADAHQADLGLDVLALVRRKVDELKKPFAEAAAEAVWDKYELDTICEKQASSPKEAKLLMLALPKPALLLVAAELGIKGVSSMKADDIRECILAGRNIKVKPAADLPLMKAAKVA